MDDDTLMIPSIENDIGSCMTSFQGNVLPMLQNQVCVSDTYKCLYNCDCILAIMSLGQNLFLQGCMKGDMDIPIGTAVNSHMEMQMMNIQLCL